MSNEFIIFFFDYQDFLQSKPSQSPFSPDNRGSTVYKYIKAGYNIL